MKDNKQKIYAIALIAVIILGIGITAIKGLNLSNEYKETQAIQISFGKDFNSEEVKTLVEEITGNKVKVQVVEMFKTIALIKSNEFTEEQVEEIVNKINEKYELELDKENIEIEKIPNYEVGDMVKPYIIPITISAVLILISMIICYRKQVTIKFVLEIIAEFIVTGLLVLSAYAIFRIPVNAFFMPVFVSAFIALATFSLIFLTFLTKSSYLRSYDPIIKNSSPPHLPTIKLLDAYPLNISDNFFNTKSPDGCPYSSFTFLKKSISIIATLKGLLISLHLVIIFLPMSSKACLLYIFVNSSKSAFLTNSISFFLLDLV